MLFYLESPKQEQTFKRVLLDEATLHVKKWCAYIVFTMECLKFIYFSNVRWLQGMGVCLLAGAFRPSQFLAPRVVPNTVKHKFGQIYTEQKFYSHPSNSSWTALGVFLCSRPPECFSRLNGWALAYGSSTKIMTYSAQKWDVSSGVCVCVCPHCGTKTFYF